MLLVYGDAQSLSPCALGTEHSLALKTSGNACGPLLEVSGSPLCRSKIRQAAE